MQNTVWLRGAFAAAISAFSSATHAGDAATSDSRDPQRTVTIAVLQAGRSHGRGGNPGPESNLLVFADPAARPAWTEVFVDSQGGPQSREQLLARFGGRYDANDPAPLREPLIRFATPWTSPYRVDPDYPFQLVNSERKHLFLLGKTAWAYFGCKDPAGVLERARAQGVNVLRVALLGRPYFEHLNIELWPYPRLFGPGGVVGRTVGGTYGAAVWIASKSSPSGLGTWK
ncbi:MAG: hypothetical protein ACYC6Y_26600 [Thermoguttaceae bacterium]